MYTVSLKHASCEPKRRIGSKAMQLAKLTEYDVRIPSGFIVTSDALERFMAVNRLLPDDSTFEHQFNGAMIPEEVRREIVAAFEQLQAESPDVAVAVRSSSSAEDLQEASFAGQYETILNVTDLPHLLESLKQCWASLFSARVREYAQRKNVKIGFDDIPMGVLIQQMVQADVSGVVFSVNPVMPNNEEIIINASYGLGEAIVSGLVTPDAYYVNKTDGSIQKELGLKEMKIIASEKETVEAETSEEEQNRFCLSDGKITELAEVARKIESTLGMPVDIEFAMKDGCIYILQARPITA